MKVSRHFIYGSMLCVASLPGCTPSPTPVAQTPSSSDSPATSALFSDVATESKLDFKHVLGNAGRFYYVESTPAGCAFVDYNNDGYQDVFLVQSGPAAPPKTVQSRPSCALFLNRGNGTFKNVTKGSGVDKNLGYAQGVAVGDYDNDGYDDLFITAYGGNHLLRNLGGIGKFQDVTQPMGLAQVHDTGFATSAAWGDYDNDGRLDLYVCYYSHWSYTLDKPCYSDDGKTQDYCSPTRYPAVTHQLFHNTGQGFVDVSQKSGISGVAGRGLAVTFTDYNAHRKADIFVANDQNPSMLWRNNGNGTFTDVANNVGTAYDGQGQLLAGMGIAVADYNRSGLQSFYISNFSSRANILYKNGGGYFTDATQEAGLGFSHLKFLSFGCEFLDYDADGWPDIITNNGHVQMQESKREAGVGLKMRKQLLHNQGNGRFEEITKPSLLGDLSKEEVGRGLATGDFDNDGRVDVMAMGQNAPVQLLRNQTQVNGNHFLSFLLRGTKSNRNAIGAKIRVQTGDPKMGGSRQVAWISGGSSFLSSSDRRVFFGLGKKAESCQVQISWPSGTQQTLKNIQPDFFYVIEENKGISEKRAPIARQTR